jgi:hypothetical protein
MADRPLRRDDYQPRKAMIAPLSARMSADDGAGAGDEFPRQSANDVTTADKPDRTHPCGGGGGNTSRRILDHDALLRLDL